MLASLEVYSLFLYPYIPPQWPHPIALISIPTIQLPFLSPPEQSSVLDHSRCILQPYCLVGMSHSRLRSWTPVIPSPVPPTPHLPHLRKQCNYTPNSGTRNPESSSSFWCTLNSTLQQASSVLPPQYVPPYDHHLIQTTSMTHQTPAKAFQGPLPPYLPS